MGNHCGGRVHAHMDIQPGGALEKRHMDSHCCQRKHDLTPDQHRIRVDQIVLAMSDKDDRVAAFRSQQGIKMPDALNGEQIDNFKIKDALFFVPTHNAMCARTKAQPTEEILAFGQCIQEMAYLKRMDLIGAIPEARIHATMDCLGKRAKALWSTLTLHDKHYKTHHAPQMSAICEGFLFPLRSTIREGIVMDNDGQHTVRKAETGWLFKPVFDKNGNAVAATVPCGKATVRDGFSFYKQEGSRTVKVDVQGGKHNFTCEKKEYKPLTSKDLDEIEYYETDENWAGQRVKFGPMVNGFDMESWKYDMECDRFFITQWDMKIISFVQKEPRMAKVPVEDRESYEGVDLVHVPTVAPNPAEKWPSIADGLNKTNKDAAKTTSLCEITLRLLVQDFLKGNQPELAEICEELRETRGDHYILDVVARCLDMLDHANGRSKPYIRKLCDEGILRTGCEVHVEIVEAGQQRKVSVPPAPAARDPSVKQASVREPSVREPSQRLPSQRGSQRPSQQRQPSQRGSQAAA